MADEQYIEKLTPEQEAMIEPVREEWIKHGLSCEPMDKEAAIEGVYLAYQNAKIDPPNMIFTMDSPLEGALAVHLMQTTWPHILKERNKDAIKNIIKRHVR